MLHLHVKCREFSMVAQSYIPSAEVWGSRLQVWTHPGLHKASMSQYWYNSQGRLQEETKKKNKP